LVVERVCSLEGRKSGTSRRAGVRTVCCSPGRRVAGSPGRRVAGSPGRRVAGSPGRRVAGSPGRRVAGSPGRRVAECQEPMTAFLMTLKNMGQSRKTALEEAHPEVL
jgi:hypothetical protein